MSESGRAEEDKRQTGEMKEDDRKEEVEVDVEANAPGSQMDDGKGVGFYIDYLNVTLLTLIYIFVNMGMIKFTVLSRPFYLFI